MLLKKTSDWLKEPENSGILYFIQRLDELTYPYTLDSYRASTANVPFLIRECLEVVSDHEEHDINPAHIERIWTELETRMAGNFIAANLMRVPWEEYHKTDLKNIESVRRALQILSAQLQPIRYLKSCFWHAKTIEPRKLEKADFIAREIVTTTINCGVEVSYISKTIEDIFFNEATASTPESIGDLFKKITPTPEKYEVCLTVRTDARRIRKNITDIFSFTFSDQPPEGGDELELKEGEAYVTVKEITAPDPFAALNYAKRTIARLHDLYGLFYHKGSYSIGQEALITHLSPEKTSIKVRSNTNNMEFIRDNRRGYADRKLEGLIKKVKLPTGKDAEKFFRVVDFHGMSLGSKIHENQLINLWTSLETIAPSQKGKSIIGSVVDGVIPFIGLQYFERIFTSLTRDLKRWDDTRLKSVLANSGIDKDLSSPEKVFCLAVMPQHDAACTELLSHMNDFPLLRNRVFTLSEKSKTGKKLHSWLESHQTRVEQQIFRIYRARNSIVHSASNTTTIGNLIVSSHDYFDQVFELSSEMCSKPYGFSNYTDCFNFCKLLYDKYKDDIKEIEDVEISHVRKIIWKYSNLNGDVF